MAILFKLYGLLARKDLNYLPFKPFDLEHIQWSLFQKRHTQLICICRCLYLYLHFYSDPNPLVGTCLTLTCFFQTLCNIMWLSLPVTCDGSVILFEYSGFLHHKTDRHDITDILLKVVLNTLTPIFHTKDYGSMSITITSATPLVNAMRDISRGE